MSPQNILRLIPQQEPFRFVDEILQVDQSGIEGVYTFRKEADFYRGHFPGKPITPGVILIECMAQIGLVGLGIYLLLKANEEGSPQAVFSSAEVDFLAPVYPEEQVVVQSEKMYFRLKKLKCKTTMHKASGELVCKGTLSGMMIL